MAKRTTRQEAKSRRSQRITAGVVKTLLRSAAEPLDWKALKEELVAGRHGGVRDLRQVLKGMLRNDELEQDHQGFYHLVGSGEVVEGVLVQRGKALYLDEAQVVRGKNGRKGSRLRAGDRVRARVSGDEARVVDVIEQSDAVLVGELNWQGRYPYVESLSADYRGRVSLIDPPPFGQHGDIVRVRIVGEDRRGLSGQVLDLIEGETVLERAIETVVASHHVPREWPVEIADAVEALPQRVANRVPKGREDLRKVPLVTIDGETAKDFDDAVFAEPAGSGWRLVVAIADVAHYVKKGSALDLEANERGNSVYLPNTVFPMLPEVLSNGLCSLRPKEPRLALVCDMQIDAEGEIAEYTFHEAIIRSWQRLTYTKVAAFLGGAPLEVEDEVRASLDALHSCYVRMLEARHRRGALDFDGHEANLRLKKGRVVEITPVVRNDAHRLIEEAMIAANVCAADFLESESSLSLYRAHPEPSLIAQQELRGAFSMVGVRLERTLSPKTLQQALAQVAANESGWVFQMLVLRAMQQAVYQPDHVGHFGLALSSYMHFTSPIRRYSDLLVHRAIKAVLRGKRPPYKKDRLQEIGTHISFTERRAEQAEWAVQGWLKCDFLQDRVGDTFSGRIASVAEFGLFVELDGYFVQGMVHVSELGQDYYQFQAETMSLVGERSGHSYRLGENLQVRITDVRPPLGRIDLEIVGGKTKASGRRRR